MFIFLSKLLPLFLYPLGLTCLLLVVALLTFWKRPRTAAGAIALALTILLLGGNGWVANQLVRSLEWQNLPAAELPTADAIVVLGGATKSSAKPRPGVDLSEAGDRVVYGAQLYREGKAPLLILSGGRINWRGGGSPESADMAALMQSWGVPQSAILQDPRSLNTYENAVNVKQILKSHQLKRILLVTSAMHMPRSRLIFRRQGIEAVPAPTDFLVTELEVQELQSSPESFLLNLLPDADRLQQSSRVLKEYLGLVIYRLRGWL
uniref:YdcF family protein n=1 Tax=Trichocoleus desertorum TaxID=1481672 RepID=UPI0025B54288|nr:YdcF family protein [Trichocoleus desertorum]